MEKELKMILKKIRLFNYTKNIYLLLVKLKNIIRNFLFPTAIVLTYHRVAETKNDPYELAVNSENFFNQLKYLKDNYRIISLNQLLIELRNKKLKRNTVVITFDDGYADNFYNALPILKQLNIPATVFVSSGNLQKDLFYWDDNDKSDKYNRPLTSEELKKLGDDNLISIGGHTFSHLHIINLIKEEKTTEIVSDKNKLEFIITKDINLFSFPFGEFDSESIEVIKNAKYLCSCILEHRRVTNTTNAYLLPRFIVRNWKKEEFIKIFKTKFL